MRTLLLICLLLALPQLGHTMSVASYEKTAAMADAPGPNRNMAKLSIESYFQGMSETLTFLKSGAQHIYFQDAPYLCFPSSVSLTGAFLKGLLDGELKSPESVLRSLGVDWKEYQIPTVLIPLVARTFPCPK